MTAMSSQGGMSQGAPATSSQNNNYYKSKVPKGYSEAKTQKFTPEAIEMLQGLYGHLGPDSWINKMASGDQSAFDEMEAPAMKQFGDLMGGMASKFSGMGMGARKSSGFSNSGTAAASDFAQNLASKRQEMRSNALKDLMGMSHNLMNEQPYETSLVEKQKKETPWWQTGLTALAGAAGTAIGGPLGGAAAGWVSNAATNAFND
jgi:hypothetical protein